MVQPVGHVLVQMDEDADGVEGDPEDLLAGLVEAATEADAGPDDAPDAMGRAKAVYEQANDGRGGDEALAG